MNQFSPESMKTLIEISSELTKEYSDKGALLFSILRSAVRLVKCELCSFISFDNGSKKIRITASLLENDEINCDVELNTDSVAFNVISSQKSLIANEIENNQFYQEKVKDRLPVPVSNLLVCPVIIDFRCVGVIELCNKDHGLLFLDDDLLLIEELCRIVANSIKTFEKINSQKEQIVALRTNSQNLSQGGMKFHDFICESAACKDVLEIVKKAAVTNSSILITGESGAGKELFAEQIYLNSRRAGLPFVRVNCASLSETLMESELFGHIKGAYTSADSAQKGRFEMADGGTLFLDEVGEIPLSLQAKLLRVIQDKQFERVGSSETISVDVRIIAATNRNLSEMVSAGTFREDLYFRLNVLPIRIPPLRQRKEDILPIARMFLGKYSAEVGKAYSDFSEAAVKAMEAYRWPGNVRELENAVARACIIGNPPVIQSADLRLTIDPTYEKGKSGPSAINEFSELAEVFSAAENSDRTLKTAQDKFKKAYVIKILEEVNWNQTKASKILGIQRTYVSRLMNELNIRENK